ncbi:MAG: hypothetical protein HY800_02800, partial [Ignavibacteriales bacterium]|nr:hypothetical protein [Ignavibacteriales bacterium]
EKIQKGEGQFGETEAESAAIGYAVLRYLAEKCDLQNIEYSEFAKACGVYSKYDELIEVVRDIFLEPFYEYIDEALDDQRAMLNLLYRYKQRSKWFHRTRLWELSQSETKKSEKSLALDLYSYLYDQGIDFTIEPSSITGEIDLIAAQGSEDPLLVDTKIFDAVDRSKSYIRKGFNQIYTYTQQYNEPFGYLVIFKITDRDLRFSLSEQSRNIPVIIHNHKTIFLITIDIYPNPKPVSQRDPIKAIEISESEFVSTEENI